MARLFSTMFGVGLALLTGSMLCAQQGRVVRPAQPTTQAQFQLPSATTQATDTAATVETEPQTQSDGVSVVLSDMDDSYFSASDASCCDTGCRRGGFLRSLLKRSDHCLDDFISPITNPVFFEDPRNLTEARFIFLNHRAPIAVGGGDVQLYALQLRAKLSDNVSLIATKDGYVNSSNPVLDDGWADLSAGLKFNLIRDGATGCMLSSGFTFELPTGEASAWQGNGDGELNLFVTGGRRIGCRSHWLSAGGWRIPFNSSDESQSMYWSNHFDYQLTQRFYLLTEFNWYHWTKAGTGGIPGVEGLDLYNLGSTGVAGNDIVTAALGAKFKPHGGSEIGFAWEFPLTERRDILDNRLALDWIVRY